jgi:hypothetical protein
LIELFFNHDDKARCKDYRARFKDYLCKLIVLEQLEHKGELTENEGKCIEAIF